MATDKKPYSIQKVVQLIEVVLADNGTVTPEILLGGSTLVGIQLPAGILSTALTFQSGNSSGGTYTQLTKQDGTAVTYVIAASKSVAIDPKDFYGVNFLKLVFGTSETGGPLTIICSLKGF